MARCIENGTSVPALGTYWIGEWFRLRSPIPSPDSRCRFACDGYLDHPFLATLEHELLADAPFVSRDAAWGAIFDFIEVWYNGERRHSSLGYVSPVMYEQHLLAQPARAA